ncbi:hypothetical protein BJX96DRAFT_180587 [Aspergillus floccosus]
MPPYLRSHSFATRILPAGCGPLLEDLARCAGVFAELMDGVQRRFAGYQQRVAQDQVDEAVLRTYAARMRRLMDEAVRWSFQHTSAVFHLHQEYCQNAGVGNTAYNTA